jgi:hypothetical protein
MRWTWFIEREGQCWPETFATPAEAIDAMGERQNWDSQEVDIPARMAALGMFLASVRVTVEPLMVLRPRGVGGTDA